MPERVPPTWRQAGRFLYPPASTHLADPITTAERRGAALIVAACAAGLFLAATLAAWVVRTWWPW
jgi:hypothetical protein